LRSVKGLLAGLLLVSLVGTDVRSAAVGRLAAAQRVSRRRQDTC
jgi:hypothetical protein